MMVISECRYILFGQIFERWLNKFDEYNGLPFERRPEEKQKLCCGSIPCFYLGVTWHLYFPREINKIEA